MKPRTFLLSLSLLLWGCDSTDSTAGTNDETTTTLATILRPDGRPASGARVLVYAAGDTQSAPVGSGRVDEQGRVALVSAPKAGWYNLLVKDDSGRAVFEDSLVSDGHRLAVLNDTLRRTARVTGRVQVQPQDKPTIAWVQLLGAGRYSNLDDSGRFVFDSVPAGRMTLAALTLVPKYTPTFRAVRTTPDSTFDAGTIPLVYTGLPQVQKVTVRWDSVANTATLTWNAAADTMVTGYTVYRTTQANPASFSPVGYVSTGTSWTDTLFGDRGILGRSLDSVQVTVRYQVVATTYLGDGPPSRPDSANVRSPLLVGAWKPTWTAGTLPHGADPTTLDSIGGRLGVLAVGDTQTILWTSDDGSNWTLSLGIGNYTATYTDTIAHIGYPTTGVARLWKGKLVWCTARTSGRTYQRFLAGRFTAIDSLVVHRFDGIDQDSSTLAVHGDSVSLAVLVPARDTLALFEQIGGGSACYLFNYWNAVDWKSADGLNWEPDTDSSAAWWFREQSGRDGTRSGQILSLPNSTFLVSSYIYSACIPWDSATVWHPSSLRRPRTFNWGLSPETGRPYWGIPAPAQLNGAGDRLYQVNAVGGALRWAPVANPSSQHRIDPPGPDLRSLQIWRSKLWVSDGTTLWSTPLP